MLKKILVANRGAVARRILRAARALGIGTVAVYSDADAGLSYVEEADEAYRIGAAPPAASYLRIEALLDVARRAGADAVHPGYGFLSESPAFAQAVGAAGLCFVGPSPRWLSTMGHKTRARDLMRKLGIPVGPGTGVLAGPPSADLDAVRAIGTPVIVKPAGGGGGIGMQALHSLELLPAALERARALAQAAFGCADVYAERLLAGARHIEFQIIGDRYGRVAHLFDRECSIQRRHQKLIEEAVAPLPERSRIEAMAARVARVMGDIGYDSIGTVEMLWTADAGFSFLEMNTRLQVEHGVSEEVTGVDIVQAQIRLAAGERLEEVLPRSVEARGHSIQLRICAEDPLRFLPSPGVLRTLALPAGKGIRVESGYEAGKRISPHYDSLIAKLIVKGASRADALARAAAALDECRIEGVKTNVAFLAAVLRDAEFLAGNIDLGLAERVRSALAAPAAA